ncbi:MAG: MtaA/CmuA family methyltransferase [Nitrososphaerales archaeon]
MKKLSPKIRVFAALVGGKLDKLPVTSLAGCGAIVTTEMQHVVRVFWPEAHKYPEKMARLAIASYELGKIENIRVPFDFVVEAEALGCKVKFGGIESIPWTIDQPYKNPEELKMPDDPLELGRIPVVLKAIRIVRERVGDFLPISSLIMGPLTLASLLVGTEKLLMWTIKERDYVRAFVDFATEFIIEYGKARYRAGSDIVQISDPVASPDQIKPEAFRQFAMPALIKVADNLGGIKLLHICGKTEPIISDMAECGYNGISVEESVDIAKIKPLVGDVKILGNVSSKLKAHIVIWPSR